jgi:hypothetical protein
MCRGLTKKVRARDERAQGRVSKRKNIKFKKNS